jgi:myo-inositol-1(or 4)-monophosphatase
LRDGQKTKFKIEHKGRVDLVTEMDKRSEDYVLGEIRRSFPGHHIISEESGPISGHDASPSHWYVDPLDGTVNYAHGVPLWVVSIGYAEHGKMKLGVIYDPTRNEMFSAQAGKGAWLNNRRIRVSGQTDLLQGLMVTGFPYDIIGEYSNNLDNFNRLSLVSQGVRRFGSAAMDLCYIACGRLDGYWEVRLKPWDLAAGWLIATEAGATVTDLDGNPDIMHAPYSILAATPALHAEMLKELQQ